MNYTSFKFGLNSRFSGEAARSFTRITVTLYQISKRWQPVAMARLPRTVLPGIPHHITQRGNGRAQTLFEDGDYSLYLDLLTVGAERARTEVWSYCLMPNHVHLVLVPSDGDGLWRTLGDLNRRYTGYINARRRTTGHLWQGRYGSVAMDEPHFVTALRYIALNPVRARLVKRAKDWAWSSTRALIAGQDDHVAKVTPALERVGDFAFLSEPLDAALTYAALSRAESVGRPVGSSDWLADMEARLGRKLARVQAEVACHPRWAKRYTADRLIL
ncbi:transposase [Parablastomonas sp. CN1-191]|uniref:transposase n=1 Tax=Parablastomonas sp. CN1-191 TaxID=3400908 RepID=UPI003BF91A73